MTIIIVKLYWIRQQRSHNLQSWIIVKDAFLFHHFMLEAAKESLFWYVVGNATLRVFTMDHTLNHIPKAIGHMLIELSLITVICIPGNGHSFCCNGSFRCANLDWDGKESD